MKRYNATLALAATFSAAVLLAACGGGDDEDNDTSLDISGVWTASASGVVPLSFVYALNGETYGYQIDGSTIRFFKGATYSATNSNFSFSNSRYDEGTVNTVVTTAAGRTGALNGQYTSASDSISLSFTAGGAATTFKDMSAKFDVVGTQNYDLRDFAGTYTHGLGTGSSVVLAATSATAGTLTGTAINGCNFQGDIFRPRDNRNVWKVSLRQSACTDSSRDTLLSEGLATIGKTNDNAIFLLRVLSFDGTKAWNRLETQK
jgi:hypothetical protein